MTKVQVSDIANKMPFLGKMRVRLEIRKLLCKTLLTFDVLPY